MSAEGVLEIQGGIPLNGELAISGAKNAVLPLMAAAVLTNRPVVLENVPNITDVASMRDLLVSHGVSVEFTQSQNGIKATITASDPLQPTSTDPMISRKFRASILLLGPLLARLGHAKVYLPGGDDIDRAGRPVDMHVTNLKLLKATVLEGCTENPPYEPALYVEAFAPINVGLQGPGQRRPIHLPKVSVGATQNTVMAACVASGITIIENASIEPETLDLVKLLKSFGANIDVDKTNRKIVITGQRIENYKVSTSVSLSRFSINHTVIPDRIVAGTYAIAAAITGGNIELLMGGFKDAEIIELLESEFWRLLAAGVDITRTTGGVRVARKRDAYSGNLVPISPVCVVTKPYPGFPTDLHPQWAALMCFSNGKSWIDETIFDGRFGYVEQLQKMGAMIVNDPLVNGKRVNIEGNQGLHQVYQPEVTVEVGDIRAGAALILAAHARNGITKIKAEGLDKHVKRGYEDFENKFTSVGSQMRRRRR